jgi:hypothetical protein
VTDIITQTPTEAPKRKGSTAFGFTPAMVFRHAPSQAGMVTEMDDRKQIVQQCPVADNDDMLERLAGQRVILPPGYPQLKAKLEARGATVIMWHKALDSVELAKVAFGGIDYI